MQSGRMEHRARTSHLEPTPNPRTRQWLVPSLLNAMLTLLETGRLAPPPFLEGTVFVGGEATTEETIRRYRALVPNGTPVVSFGHTETQGETSLAVYGYVTARNGM